MQKSDSVIHFLAGLGVGVAVAVLLTPEAGRTTRNRIAAIANRAADALKTRAGDLRDAAGHLLQERKSTWKDEQSKRSDTMSDLKNKARETIDDAADAAQRAADTVIDKSKDFAHSAGEQLEERGKQLQDA